MGEIIASAVYLFQQPKRIRQLNRHTSDFFSGPVIKNPPANAGNTGSIPGLGGSHLPQTNKVHAPQLLSLCSRA